MELGWPKLRTVLLTAFVAALFPVMEALVTWDPDKIDDWYSYGAGLLAGAVRAFASSFISQQLVKRDRETVAAAAGGVVPASSLPAGAGPVETMEVVQVPPVAPAGGMPASPPPAVPQTSQPPVDPRIVEAAPGGPPAPPVSEAPAAPARPVGTGHP